MAVPAAPTSRGDYQARHFFIKFMAKGLPFGQSVTCQGSGCFLQGAAAAYVTSARGPTCPSVGISDVSSIGSTLPLMH